MHLSIFMALMILWAAEIHAESRGSLFFSDIDDLVAGNSGVFGHILQDFEIFSVGDARMINRAENVKLHGARIGPYDFYLKPKGAAGPYTYEMRIQTRHTFIDAKGAKVPLAKAVDFTEEVSDVTIRPLNPDQYFTPRDDQTNNTHAMLNTGKTGNRLDTW